MRKNRMESSDKSVEDFVDAIAHQKRRRDAATLVDLMREATGVEPNMWGSIVGFGKYDYRYASGRNGTAPAAGFSPRAAATTIYLVDGVDAHSDLLEDLGPHSTGVGCLYIKDLEAVDLEVLGEIVRKSYETLTEGTFTQRARDGGKSNS
jgi:hypothetical protein